MLDRRTVQRMDDATRIPVAEVRYLNFQVFTLYVFLIIGFKGDRERSGILRNPSANNKAIPVIEDAPYCIGFGKREVPKKHGELNSSEWQFFLIFTTRRLMNKQHRSNIVQTDATYKINLLGYPVLVARFSDANKRFHPTVIGICSSQSKFAYEGVFNAIKYADLENLYHPKLVVRNADTSITAARRIVWLNSDDQLCFFHVIMNLKKELPKVAAYSDAVVEIQEDVRLLARARSDREFVIAARTLCRHWIEKWERTELISIGLGKFIASYLDRETYNKWLYRNGRESGTMIIATNCATEGINSLLKSRYTHQRQFRCRSQEKEEGRDRSKEL
uniref:MULE transposase domain-containing protein n=1 Tax=Ditylenchus dipsaci TaxID=166011 RepID=A0A915CU28_9BILA